MTPKEQQSVMGYKKSKPTQQDKFFVKYETTDDFGKNTTTVLKKLKEQNKLCWTSFSKHENSNEEGQEETGDNQGNEMVVNDAIRITKTITFVNDDEGSLILGDLLVKLDI